MRDKAGLPSVESMLTAAAKRRAERSRARRRGTGFAVIAFAGLALAGSAAAATGLWDPLPFGGGHGISKHAGEDGAGAQTASVLPAPDLSPGGSRSGPAKERGRTRGASGRASALGADLPTATPLLPSDQGAPSGDDGSGREPRGGGTAQDGTDGGSHPTPPGDGPGPGGGGPPEGPGEEKGTPGPSQLSVACSSESVAVGQPVTCKAVVRGNGPAPTGTVLFKSAGAGSFSTNPCTLGNGSSCAVTYTPEGTGAHQITVFYSGDRAYASDATSFAIKAIP